MSSLKRDLFIGKGKGHPTTDYDDTEVCRGIALLLL